MTKDELLQALANFGKRRGRLPLFYYATDNAGKTFGAEDANTLIRVASGLGANEKIDLIIHTDGGSMGAAKRLALVLREVTDDLNVLVPFKAKSAGTILAISANRIEMGFGAELGAIDPIIKTARDQNSSNPEFISSEDIRNMHAMCREWFGIDSKAAGPLLLQFLGQKIFPTTLASFYRSQKAVYQTCEVLLRYQMPKSTRRQRAAIAKELVAGSREHSDPILRPEATAIGLAVTGLDKTDEALLRDLCQGAKRFCVNFLKLEPAEFSTTALIATPHQVHQYGVDTRTPPFAQKGWREG